jgi:hypothetical protein
MAKALLGNFKNSHAAIIPSRAFTLHLLLSRGVSPGKSSTTCASRCYKLWLLGGTPALHSLCTQGLFSIYCVDEVRHPNIQINLSHTPHHKTYKTTTNNNHTTITTAPTPSTTTRSTNQPTLTTTPSDQQHQHQQPPTTTSQLQQHYDNLPPISPTATTTTKQALPPAPRQTTEHTLTSATTYLPTIISQ